MDKDDWINILIGLTILGAIFLIKIFGVLGLIIVGLAMYLINKIWLKK